MAERQACSVAPRGHRGPAIFVAQGHSFGRGLCRKIDMYGYRTMVKYVSMIIIMNETTNLETNMLNYSLPPIVYTQRAYNLAGACTTTAVHSYLHR